MSLPLLFLFLSASWQLRYEQLSSTRPFHHAAGRTRTETSKAQTTTPLSPFTHCGGQVLCSSGKMIRLRCLWGASHAVLSLSLTALDTCPAVQSGSWDRAPHEAKPPWLMPKAAFCPAEVRAGGPGLSSWSVSRSSGRVSGKG